MRRQTSIYGEEVVFEMVVKLPQGVRGGSYMLTLTQNSLDLAPHELVGSPQREGESPAFDLKEITPIPQWSAISPNKVHKKPLIGSISRNNILGITQKASNSHAETPFLMTIFHLSSNVTPTFSKRLTIEESVLLFNSFEDFERLQLLLNFKPGKSNWLIFINPKAGKGEAKKVFHKAKPVLEAAGLILETYETKHKDDAYNYILQSPVEEIQKFDTFICCSGDGTVHEVINGFFERKDCKELTLRLGCLPSGSACCLLFNALKERGLEMTLENSVYLLLRGEYKEMPLMRYTMQPYNRVGSFL
jgi:hypothetical protein